MGRPPIDGARYLSLVVDRLTERTLPPSRSGIYTTTDPHRYLVHRAEPELLECFDGIYVGGELLRAVLELAGVKRMKRKSFDMTSLGKEVLEWAHRDRVRTYFIGAREQEVGAAVGRLRARFPGMKVVGHRHGYFDSEGERARVLRGIKELEPELCVVGMGAPTQEAFLRDLVECGWKGLGYTCGGFLRQTAERLEYYPRWVDRWELRWMYRMVREIRISKRVATYYPRFLGVIAHDIYQYRRRERGRMSDGRS